MANALKMTGGPEAQKTAEFIGMIDKFFDCLNVTNFQAGKHSRNTFKDPFRPGDFRLEVPKPYLTASKLMVNVIIINSGLKTNSWHIWTNGNLAY